MKQKQFKNFIQTVVLLFLIPLMYYGCLDDETIIEEVVIEEKSKDGLQLMKMDYGHFKLNNSSIANKVDKYTKENQLNSRTTSSIYDFSIQEDLVQIIESSTFTTYTFIVERDISEENILENYMLKENNDGSYSQYLLKYSYSIEEDGTIIYDTDFLGIEKIEDESLITGRSSCFPELIDVNYELTCSPDNCGEGGENSHGVGDSTCVCITAPYPGCVEAGSTWTCDYEAVFVMSECGGGDPTSDTPDGNTDGPGDPPVGGGGSTGDDNDDTNDENTDPEEEEEIDVVPLNKDKILCKKINELENDDVFKQKMVTLKNAAEQWSFEKLFTVNTDLTPNSSPSQTDNFDYGEFQGTISNPYVQWSVSDILNFKGIIHSHYSNLLSVLSTTDLADLYNIMKISSVTDSFFYGLVNDEGVAYILQIHDRSAFLEFGEKRLSTKSKIFKFTRDIYEKKYNIKQDNSDTQNEWGFIKMLQEMGTGVSVFKSTDNTYTNYNKLKFRDNQVVPSDCN